VSLKAGASHRKSVVNFKKLLQAKSKFNFQDVAEEVQQGTTPISECERLGLEYEKIGSHNVVVVIVVPGASIL